jgi:hypothetical protein
MALIFLDGFDKYGPANTNATGVATLMTGEWNTITGVTIVAPLSATGQAISITGGNAGPSKTLPAAVGRIIGGMRLSSNLAAIAGVQFNDGASNQCSISIATTGIITMRNGVYNTGTILGSSATSIAANTTHYLEWDISLGNSAAYNVYLDGVSVVSGTGDTTATANNTVSVIMPITQSSEVLIVDDFYLFDSTGSTNNAPLLTSPRIETTLPTSDSAVQLAIGASVLGETVLRSTSTLSTGANYFFVRPFIPTRACTLNSITVQPNATSATVNLRPIVYTDSSTAPSALLTAGSTVTGMTAGTPVVMPLTAPQSLTAGTRYWLGLMADIGVTVAFPCSTSNSTGGRSGTSTFSGGAPGTAPGTVVTGDALLWGNITLASPANYYEVSQQPPPSANTSYVFDATVGHEDLYGFPNLSVIPASVYAVAVKAFCARSDSGARTVSLRTKSSATDGGGSLTGQTPGTSYLWIGSNFETDPNGSIPWTGTTLNAAQSGFKVDA